MVQIVDKKKVSHNMRNFFYKESVTTGGFAGQG